jgi:hypothetical protein
MAAVTFGVPITIDGSGPDAVGVQIVYASQPGGIGVQVGEVIQFGGGSGSAPPTTGQIFPRGEGA